MGSSDASRGCLLDGNGAPASGRVQPAREAQPLGRRARARRMAGALRAKRRGQREGLGDLKSKEWDAAAKKRLLFIVGFYVGIVAPSKTP